jgi:urea carboxylase
VAGQADYVAEPDGAPAQGADDAWPDAAVRVATQVPGSVWKVLVTPGAVVRAGDTLVVIESMKMEFAVVAPSDGVVLAIACSEGGTVRAGQPVVVVRQQDRHLS